MKDTTLLFTLTDADGIRAASRCGWRWWRCPTSRRSWPCSSTASARPSRRRPGCRLAGRITDDYGIGRVWFEYAVDHAEAGRSHDSPRCPIGPRTFPLADAALEVARAGARSRARSCSLSVKAADLCDLGRGPNVAGSERWLLDVVTPEQLRAMLEARELVLRQRFEQMIQEMTETRDLLARLEFDAPNRRPSAEATATAEARRRRAGRFARPADATLRLLRVDGALTNCRKSTQEVLGLAEAFDDIRKQLVNNRIDTEELKNRLQGGHRRAAARTIADAMFPELERRLEALQAALDDAGQGPRPARAGPRQQADDILLAMRKVLDRMIELEDFNEAVDLLRNIIKMQDSSRQTQQRHKQKIRELLKD